MRTFHKRNSYKYQKLAYCIFLFLPCAGCALRSVYIPVTQNTPLFDSARQIKANGYVSYNHIEMQGAATLTKHIALAGNINFGSGIGIYDFAIGLYDHSRSGTVRYEIFGGYGYNSNVNTSSSVLSYFSQEKLSFQVNSLYRKLYVQPSIGYFNEMNIFGIRYAFIFSARASYIMFNDYLYREIDATKTIDPNNPVYLTNKEYVNKKLFLLEPALTNKVGKKNFYGVLQLQAIMPYSAEIDVRNTKFSPGIVLSVGVEYDFGKRIKK